MSRPLRMLAALLLCAAASCSSDDTASFFLRIEGADGATQVSVSVLRDGEPWFGPELRPPNEGTPFSGEQTLRIRFNTPPNQPVRIAVDALLDGTRIAEGSIETTPRKGEEMELRIALSRVVSNPGTDGGTDAGTDDAGTPDAGDPDGGNPDAGEPDAGLPDAGPVGCNGCPGCCRDNVCVNPPSVNNCGVGGEACNACDTERADRCSAFGRCSCGEEGGLCAPGQRCVNAACVCDSASCPDGCCSNNTCQPGDTYESCGTAGAACRSCVLLQSCRQGRCG